jgi:hypothetical protein
MDKFDILLKTLNELKIEQTSEWVECIPDSIWVDYFEHYYEFIKKGLDTERHRHYELSTEVFKIYDRFMGVESITNVYSEQSSISDCCHTLEFFEMKPIVTTTFDRI